MNMSGYKYLRELNPYLTRISWLTALKTQTVKIWQKGDFDLLDQHKVQTRINFNQYTFIFTKAICRELLRQCSEIVFKLIDSSL